MTTTTRWPRRRQAVHEATLRSSIRRRSAASAASAVNRKGRPVEPQALAEIRALLGDAPRRRDLLIEFLHRIQDRYGHISAAHIVALAEELKLARTEVYEVATFYHHFDVRQGRRDAAAGADGADLRDAVLPDGGRRCAARARSKRAAARRAGHRRAVHRPLRARAGRARRAQSGRRSDAGKDRGGDSPQAQSNPSCRRTSTTPRTAPAAATDAARVLHRGEPPGRRGHRGDGGFRPARPGRRGIPCGAQVENRPRGTRAAADGGQHRRGRAGHVQGSLLPRARSASLPRGHADRRVGGRHRRHLRLSARRVRGMPRDSRARARGACRPTRRSRCRRSICGAAPARTSAAKSRR